MDYEAFFKRKTETVARDLLGRLIIRRTESGTEALEIAETGAYVEGVFQEGKPREDRLGMMYDSGNIFLMQFRGHNMLNIASGKGEGGACVEIRKVRGLNQRIDGSGAIANYFGLTRDQDNTPLGEESGLFISDEKFRKGNVQVKDGAADNCVGIYSIE